MIHENTNENAHGPSEQPLEAQEKDPEAVEISETERLRRQKDADQDELQRRNERNQRQNESRYRPTQEVG